ncbi:MAG: ABC transporter permease [Thermoanaerobaculia bacterium]
MSASDSVRRISALLLRYLYLYRRSLARMGEIFFWPVMDLVVWGFVIAYLERMVLPKTVLFFLGGVIFWDILYRAQQAITLTITDEIWVRNIINIFIAPLRTGELLAATALMGVIRAITSAVVLGSLAWALYHFNLLHVGLLLVPFVGSLLLFGWAVGMFTTALILRFGHAAEALVWGVPFLLQPISAVFYPVDVFPAWLRPVALALPSTHIFEGMRSALQGHFAITALLTAVALNLVYLVLGALFFGWMLNVVRRRGLLSRLAME